MKTSQNAPANTPPVTGHVRRSTTPLPQKEKTVEANPFSGLTAYQKQIRNNPLQLLRTWSKQSVQPAGRHAETPGQLRSPYASVQQGVMQLKSGFEAETKIPVYGQSPVGDQYVEPEKKEGWQASVGDFLFGGLEYGNFATDPGGHFMLNADHNEITREHTAIVSLLMVSGLLKEEIDKKKMANLEYVTFARDEIGPSSHWLVSDDLRAMRVHMQQTLELARSGRLNVLPDIAAPFFTGIPRKELLTWAETNGLPAGILEPYLSRMEALMTNSLFLQQTTGILPEDIPDLYRESGEKSKGTNYSIRSLMSDLMLKSAALGENAFAALKESAPQEIQLHGKAVTGFLTFMASFLLADSVSFSPDIALSKNLLPYFPKVKLEVAFEALPPSTRAERDFWIAAIDLLCDKSLDYPETYWKQTYQLGELDLAGRIFGDDRGKHRKAKGEFQKMVSGQETKLGVEKGDLSLDEQHASIEKEKQQKGIPLEDRYFGHKQTGEITMDNVEETLSTSFSRAYERTSKHLPPSLSAPDIHAKPDEVTLCKIRIEDLIKRARSLRGTITYDAIMLRSKSEVKLDMAAEYREDIKVATKEKERIETLLAQEKQRLKLVDLDIQGELDRLSEEMRKVPTHDLEGLTFFDEQIKALRQTGYRGNKEKLQDLKDEIKDYEQYVKEYETFVPGESEKAIPYQEAADGLDVLLEEHYSMKMDELSLNELQHHRKTIYDTILLHHTAWTKLRNLPNDETMKFTHADALNHLATHTTKYNKKRVRNSPEQKQKEDPRLLQAQQVYKSLMQYCKELEKKKQRDLPSVEKLLGHIEQYNELVDDYRRLL